MPKHVRGSSQRLIADRSCDDRPAVSGHGQSENAGARRFQLGGELRRRRPPARRFGEYISGIRARIVRSSDYNRVAADSDGVTKFITELSVRRRQLCGLSHIGPAAKLTASDGQFGDEFGYSVAISGNTVVVGASNDPSTNAAYVFAKPASGWATTSKFTAKLKSAGSSIFGLSVAANGRTIVAGA